MTKPGYTEEYFGTWTPAESFTLEVLTDVAQSLRYGQIVHVALLEDVFGEKYSLRLYELQLPGRAARSWAWTLLKDGVLVGAGSLERPYYREQTQPVEEVLAALSPEARHRSLYAKILRVLRSELGPLLSDWTLSASAVAAWRKAGGTVERVGDYPRMRLNPRKRSRT